ncbi:MAG TPA: hypothetical protein VLK34_08235 [Nocardioidaceae bacterium]|nr:hypothetical protein [Nocardioidaceae bacterium]
MNIEEIVRTSMDQLARELQPTVPNPAAVRARVNRSRRARSIAVVGLAAAAAAAVVFGVSDLRDHSSGAGPTHSVELGESADAVWMMDGVLHIGDQAYPQDKEIVTALVPTKNGAVYGAPGGQIVYQPADGPAQVISTDGDANPPGGPTPVGPAADPDSDLVAILRWSTADGRYDLYIYDPARGRQLGTGMPLGDDTWDLPGDPNPFGGDLLAPIYWVGPNDGEYTVLIRNRQQLWGKYAKGDGSASGLPLGKAPLDATLDVLADVDADGTLTFTTLDRKPLSSVDDVEPDGGLSHDGVYFAGLSADPEHSGAVAIVDTNTGDVRYIDPPEGTVPMFPSWSRGHTLMFRAPLLESAPSGLVVACDADSLACVNVAEVDDINQTVLPRI